MLAMEVWPRTIRGLLRKSDRLPACRLYILPSCMNVGRRHSSTTSRSDHDRSLVNQIRASELAAITRLHTALTVPSAQPPSLKDLISKIPPIRVPWGSRTSANPDGRWTGRIIVLVTPSYATAALADTALFLPLLQKQRMHPHALMAEVVVAVVDGLPSLGSKTCHANEQTDHDMNSVQKASQGITVMHGVRSAGLERGALGDSVSTNAVGPTAIERQPDHQRRGLAIDMDLEGRPGRVRTLRLGLANTTFINNTPETLRRDCWEVESSGKATLSSQKDLHLATIRLPPSRIENDLQNVKMSLPLLPLTPTRHIADAMGNIVRQLESGLPNQPNDSESAMRELGMRNSSTTVPASSELEAAIQKYFKVKNTDQHRVALWALVSKEPPLQNSKPADLEKCWLLPQELEAHQPKPDYDRGDLLCRVVSGGGGWGKKAGLIALDPDTFERKHSLDMQALEDKYIQFFIASEPTKAQSTLSSLSSSKQEHSAAPTPTLTFGVIPSTIDDLPSPPSAETNTTEPQIHVYENVFGALTESSIWIHDSKLSFEKKNTFPSLKIDVPYATWTYTAFSERGTVVSGQDTDSLTVNERLSLAVGDGAAPFVWRIPSSAEPMRRAG